MIDAPIGSFTQPTEFFLTYYIVICLSALLFSLIGTGVAWRLLGWINVVDVPNERSNHAQPVPRGGGMAVIFAALAFMMVSGAPAQLLWAALLLAVVSFIDDRKGLLPSTRLGVQAVAVLLAVPTLSGHIFQGLIPWWIDWVAAAFLWMWMINLTNFMDGIDGITAAQVISVCIGLILLTISVDDLPKDIAIDAGILASVALGFAFWNWHPARIFLGDVGSIPLGFLLGYLPLITAEAGYWAAALILPAYYLLDATLTLLKRAMGGKKIWESHSEHAYQQAVRAGKPHDVVVRDIIALNIMLVVLAIASTLSPVAAWISLAVAYALCLGVITYFRSTVVHPFYAHSSP